MDVTQLPFNRLIGLEPAAADSGFLVGLPEGPQYTNHLRTVHAGALLAVAEAGSGTFLARHMGGRAGFVPVVRRMDSKFCRPASGQVWARVNVPPEEVARWMEKLETRGRTSAAVPVEVVDTAGSVVLTAVVEWFITRGGPDAESSATADGGKTA
jgi:acyl-coenzyme A thioesterase PaaI-like protein